jgi:hypothetical protein
MDKTDLILGTISGDDVFRTLEMAYVMHKAGRLKQGKHPKNNG